MAGLRSASMVGRDAQMAVLRELAAAAGSRRPSVVAVLGEAGIGKTRLVDQLAQELSAESVLVARGNCAPGAARGLPLAPIREVIRELSSALGPRLGRLASADNPAVTALLDQPGDSQPGDAAVGSQAQLFDGVARMLRDVARPRRVLILVEDVHWTDETSRDLLEFVARSLRDERLLLVVTARTGDPDYESCRPFIADLTGLRHGTRVELARLTEEQVHDQVAELRGDRAPDAPELARIVDITEGVPLLVEEVVDADLDDVGALADVLVGHRIGLLSGPARTVAETAAVAVLEPTPAQLAEAAPLSPERFDSAFAEAVQGGVLVRHHGRVGFRHALLREATLSRTLPHAEKRLHEAWSGVIGDHPQGQEATVAAAHHRREAGDVGGALVAYLAAARLAHRFSAYAEEAHMLKQAAELWPAVPDAETRTGTRLCDVYADAAFMTHLAMNTAEAQRLIDAAIDALPPDGSAHDRAMQTLLWHRTRILGDHRLSTSEVLAAVDDVSMDPPSEEAVLACLEATDALLRAGDPARAESYARRGLEVAEAMGHAEMQARSLAPLGLARARQGDYDDGLRTAERAVLLAQRTGDVIVQADTLSHAGEIGWMRCEDTLPVDERLVELLGGDRPGPLHGWWGAAQVRHAESLIDAGRWDEAQAVLDLVLAEQMPDLVFREARRVAGHLSVWRGGGAAQRSSVSHPPASHEGSGTTLLEIRLAEHYSHGDIAARSGGLLAARAHAMAVIGDDRVADCGGYLLPFLLVTARVEADLAAAGTDPAPADGEWVTDRIRHLLTLAAPRNARDSAYAEHVSAELERRVGADTPATWASVVGCWRTTSRPFPLGAALVRAGEACRAAGQVPEAGAALREAVQIGRQLGARPLVEEALAVARKAHLRLSVDLPRPASDLGLTRRELDVLRLVAEGASNSAIARTLFISPKTASVHVSNILAKLEVSSRGEAAATAHRAGLVPTGVDERSGG